MKKLLMLLTMVIIAFGLTSCGEKKQSLGEVEVEVPTWFANPPKSADYLYGIGLGKSKDMQLAINKAKQEATTDLAKKLEQKVMGMTKKFAQEIGSAEDANLLQMFEDVSKVVVNQTINGVQEKQKSIKTKPDSGIYSVYMLLEMPIGSANKALMAKLKAQEALYTKLQASKSFKELENEVDKMEQ